MSTICSAVMEQCCHGRNPERPPPAPLPPTAGKSTFCSAIRCSEEKDTIVGTSTSCSAVCDCMRQDLGHCDNLLGIRRERAEEVQDVWQLFPHLRHRIVEKRHRRDFVDDLLHGAPLYPCMRTGQGSDPVRLSPFGVLGKQIEEHRIHPGVGRNEEWCRAAANSMRTVIRSCRRNERSRRSLLRRAEPVETRSAKAPSAGLGIITVTQKGNACLSQTP